MSRPAIDCGTEGIRGAVVVMAKAPREGFVKTRLTGAYRPCDVVQLSECMLRDTLALVQPLRPDHVVAVMCPSEDVADIAALLPAGIDVVGQRGSGLAAALVSVFECFVPDFRRVIALDSDSPHLPLAILESAFHRLETNDLVVGPTEDGGYYLVGASATHPRLFDPAPLGTRNARDALLGNARARGLSVALTEPWYDVDVPADLRRLAAELRIEPLRAPRTAALLASWRPRLDAHDEELAG
jgi:rSAM/selenodomain-associated transferase 1